MVAVVGVLMGLLLLYLARGTLPLLVVAAVIAYILYPAVEWLNRRLRFPRTLATVVIYVILILVMAAIPILIGPAIIRQIRTFDVNVSELLSQGREWLRQTLNNWRSITILGMTIDLSSLIDPALETLGEEGSTPVIPPAQVWLPRLLGMVPGAVSGVASTLISGTAAFFLTIVYSFYLVKDSAGWRTLLNDWLPDTFRDEFNRLRQQLSSIWSSFFRGQLALCLSIGLMSFLALTIMGIPGSIPLALVAGVLEVIPNLGPLLALVPAVIVALIQGSTWIPLSNVWVAVLVLGVYLLIQQVENNLLVPRIIGESVDLPPLLVLIGVIVGASNAGVLGAFLAAPVLASLKVLFLYAYNKVLERPAFPEERKKVKRVKQKGPPAEEPGSGTDDAASETDASGDDTTP
jgi:predicted PurR-regulated permease PerM